MKKVFYCFLLSFLVIGRSFAQSVIHATVTDAASTPLSGCSIFLLNSVDSNSISQTVTDTAGVLSFSNVQQGSYLLQAKYAEGVSRYIPLTLSGKPSDTTLPPIKILLPEHRLNGLTITTLRPVFMMKNGALTMDVEHSPSAAGNTVLELLKRMPGVIADAQNNISVDGKKGVQFLMDGRLQQLPAAQVLLLLSNMPAEAVASIELIKTPPAKYDAAGANGLINIISRKVKIKGFSGTVTESAGMGKSFGNGLNAALDFRSNKLTLFTNATYLERNPLAESTLDRTLQTTGSTSSIYSTGSTATSLHSLLLKGGVEYAATKYTTAGINLSYAPTRSQDRVNNYTTVEAGNAFPYYQLRAVTHSHDVYSSTTATAYLQHLPDTNGTQLNFSVDYTGFSFQEKRRNENRFFDAAANELPPMQAYANNNDLDFHILIAKLDFTRHLSQSLNLESGLKASITENSSTTVLDRSNSTGVFQREAGFSNDFRYHERILAGYANFNKDWQKVSVQAGLRGEQTIIDTKDIVSMAGTSRRYFNLFPNVSFNYNPTRNSSWQFTYSYRIDRPAYDQLAPYKVFNDQLNYSTGNPGLQPQYSHVATLDYSYNHFIFPSISYTTTRNSIYSFPVTREGSNVQIDTVVNYASRSMLSANLMLQRQLAKRYQLQFSGALAYSRFTGMLNGADAGSAVMIGFVRMGNDLTLPGKLRLQVNAMINTPYRDAIQRYAARATVDISLQRRFLKDRLNAVIAVNDLFYTDKTTITTTLPDQAYRYTVRTDTRRMRLTLTYRLGNMRIDRKVKKEQEDEVKRIKKAS